MAQDAPRDAAGRPLAPVFGGEQNSETHYHNVAYKVNRVAINLEKMNVRAVRRGGARAVAACAATAAAL